jgi:predicted DNA-binding antitoxin AbrB/MazE fold protein
MLTLALQIQPLRERTTEATLEGFKKIYERGILKLPKRIDVDPGSEFKGSVRKWFDDQGIDVKIGKTGRHRQQALVERRNQIIGTALAKRQAEEELLTGEPAVEWKDDIPQLIKALNKRAATTRIQVKKPPNFPVCEGDSCKVLDRGDKVRVALEEPKNLQGRKLHGKFRSGDVRWDEKIRTIKEILIKPGFPPMYLLDGDTGPNKIEPIAYTKNQLQKVKSNEEYPHHAIIKKPEKVKHFRIEEILEKKKLKGKWMLLIKWRGYDEHTWEPYKTIKEDQPDAVAEFESSNVK